MKSIVDELSDEGDSHRFDNLIAELNSLRKKQKVLVELVNNLNALVPVRPNAITWEDGVEILNHVQDVFLPKAKQALEAAR